MSHSHNANQQDSAMPTVKINTDEDCLTLFRNNDRVIVPISDRSLAFRHDKYTLKSYYKQFLRHCTDVVAYPSGRLQRHSFHFENIFYAKIKGIFENRDECKPDFKKAQVEGGILENATLQTLLDIGEETLRTFEIVAENQKKAALFKRKIKGTLPLGSTITLSDKESGNQKSDATKEQKDAALKKQKTKRILGTGSKIAASDLDSTPILINRENQKEMRSKFFTVTPYHFYITNDHYTHARKDFLRLLEENSELNKNWIDLFVQFSMERLIGEFNKLFKIQEIVKKAESGEDITKLLQSVSEVLKRLSINIDKETINKLHQIIPKLRQFYEEKTGQTSPARDELFIKALSELPYFYESAITNTRNLLAEEIPLMLRDCRKAKKIFEISGAITYLSYPAKNGEILFKFLHQLMLLEDPDYNQYFRWLDVTGLLNNINRDQTHITLPKLMGTPNPPPAASSKPNEENNRSSTCIITSKLPALSAGQLQKPSKGLKNTYEFSRRPAESGWPAANELFARPYFERTGEPRNQSPTFDQQPVPGPRGG